MTEPRAGGGGGYTALAVHFDGTASLINEELAATNGPTSLCAIWLKFAALQPVPSSAPVWVVDPDGDYKGYCSFTEEAPGVISVSAPGVDAATVDSDAAATGTWLCLLCSITNEGTRQLYIGDTSSVGGGGGGTGVNAFDGLPFYFGADSFGDGAVFDVADFRMWTNQALDLSVQANRRLFIDGNGKPVDPATATLALGAPTILFSGNLSTFGTNQGNGGSFALTGSLTNASTSPSDP
jgi:hypothetical protein